MTRDPQQSEIKLLRSRILGLVDGFTAASKMRHVIENCMTCGNDFCVLGSDAVDRNGYCSKICEDKSYEPIESEDAVEGDLT